MPVDLIRVWENSPLLSDVMKLYASAFPANERRPLKPLLTDRSDAGEVLAIREGDLFIGLVVLLSFQDITHIIYLAVPEPLRGRGYGAQILSEIQKRYPRQRIIADLEEPDGKAANNAQRERRVAFYARNGFSPTEIRYAWRGEKYVIVAANGTVSEDEFEAFWDYFYSGKAGFDY
ncbi:MAG: GNAT family N-acetyltransferase [Clostridia bacterium]|nr:GNAT family N-acetyltransferase [Clostridia bacterium]